MRKLTRARGPGAPRAGRADGAQARVLRFSGAEGWAGRQRRGRYLGGPGGATVRVSGLQGKAAQHVSLTWRRGLC